MLNQVSVPHLRLTRVLQTLCICFFRLQYIHTCNLIFTLHTSIFLTTPFRKIHISKSLLRDCNTRKTTMSSLSHAKAIASFEVQHLLTPLTKSRPQPIFPKLSMTSIQVNPDIHLLPQKHTSQSSKSKVVPIYIFTRFL